MSKQEVYIIDVLSEAISEMMVAVPGSDPIQYFTVNFEPGLTEQIIESLKTKDGTSYQSLKYPLIGVIMPFPERNSSGFLEINIPRIVIAYLTKTDSEEFVKQKYNSDGIFKTILRPCLREFIKWIAFSRYTSFGDPEMYEYTTRDYPSSQMAGDGLQDYLDIIEILNLKIIIYPQLNNC